MITVFRLVKEKYADDAFTGGGSRRFGGRWNHKGTSVAYLSDTFSLAALEQFIHLGREGLHLNFVYFSIEIPDDVSVEVIEPKTLPKDWRQEPPPNSTKDLGSKWAKSNSSVLLKVPAVIVPIGFNYLVNINHPEFDNVVIHDPKPYTFDLRMWK